MSVYISDLYRLTRSLKFIDLSSIFKTIFGTRMVGMV